MAALQVYWRKKLEIKFTITSNCPYYYECMQSENAAVSSNNMPSTNIPIHCPVCPLSFSGNPQTIWKYNALYYLISEHSSNGIIPEIPGELLVKMFIHKAEEEALGIDRKATERYRRDNQFPDTVPFQSIRHTLVTVTCWISSTLGHK